jgi:hypothetical protein
MARNMAQKATKSLMGHEPGDLNANNCPKRRWISLIAARFVVAFSVVAQQHNN